MQANDPEKLPAYRQLKKLRAALSILRGSHLLPTLQQELENTVSHDQTQRVTYLTGLFTRIHREMFSDWKEQISIGHRPGIMPDAEKRSRFRETIERLVLDGNSNHDTAIFDHNGFVIYRDDIADRLAGFYRAMRTIRPFTYGNRLTLDFFTTALGNLPSFKAVYEHGIDFRRMSHADAVALHHFDSPRRQLTTAFLHAMDPTRCRSLHNKANSYGKWPENRRFLHGIPFLSYTTADGIVCLVTVNGGLTPLAGIRVDELFTGQHLADNALCVSSNIIGHLPGTEDLRQTGKTAIDNIPLSGNGLAPLFCLDTNILTGVRSPSHADLLDLLKQCGEKTPLFSLADNPALKEKLLKIADNDVRLARTVEIAYQRLCAINRILLDSVEGIFAGKTPDPQPKLFMAMGGAGSGKTAVEEMARSQCGDNFVTASLDEFRKLSDLYRVMTAADHHSDDYVYIEPFANRLRDLVSQRARETRINLLYDGTGIPYQPRYSTLIGQFRASGFHTSIIAVDAFLIKPAGREDELSRAGVITSVKDRFQATGRALPWVVTVDKHIRSPYAFLTALNHAELDKLALFANDGARDCHYLVAESIICQDEAVDALHDHQRQGRLAEYLQLLAWSREDSVLKKLAGADRTALSAWLQRNPDLSESNVGYLVYPGSDGNRVLLIHHCRRLVDFVEKRQLNPNASGAEGLLHKPAALAFRVDPQAAEPWLTRLQGSHG